MIEKLLENWLDNASERSYQPVFVQMLSAQGYHVVHSTRHQILEYGKDILAVDPDGVGCAYQLKGNPGGSLGLRQFRDEVQPQLVQMMSQAIVFPGFPDGPHRSISWSTGLFDHPHDASDLCVTVDAEDRFNYKTKLADIKAPTLLAAGEKDPFYTPELFKETAAGIPGAVLKLYPDMGHPALGRQFEADVRKFLID